MDNTRGMTPTNDWGRYEALQIKLMRQWRAEEHRARMEVVFFDEPEPSDVEVSDGH